MKAARLRGAALLGALLALMGCKKPREVIPTERVLVVKVAAAPALTEVSPTMNADAVVRWGEAYSSQGRRADFRWEGLFEERKTRRQGLHEVRRRPQDPPRFAFEEDLLPAELPTPGWLCAKMSLGSMSAAECASSLLRTVPSESALLAHVPCWKSDCPMALFQGAAVSRASVPGLTEVRVVALDKRPVVLSWSHWVRSPEQTGSELVVWLLDPPLARAGAIALSETDARSPGKVEYFLSALSIGEDEIQVHGRRSVRDRPSNRELSGVDVHERWGLGADGKLVKR